jgi:hypothetical protein
VAQREIDDVDVQQPAVPDGEVDRFDDVADVAAALFVEHAERNDVGGRGDAGVAATRGRSVASDQSRHMCAVAVGIGRQHRLGTGTGEIVRGTGFKSSVGDARIDDRDAHASAARRGWHAEPCAQRLDVGREAFVPFRLPGGHSHHGVE